VGVEVGTSRNSVAKGDEETPLEVSIIVIFKKMWSPLYADPIVLYKYKYNVVNISTEVASAVVKTTLKVHGDEMHLIINGCFFG